VGISRPGVVGCARVVSVFLCEYWSVFVFVCVYVCVGGCVGGC